MAQPPPSPLPSMRGGQGLQTMHTIKSKREKHNDFHQYLWMLDSIPKKFDAVFKDYMITHTYQ